MNAWSDKSSSTSRVHHTSGPSTAIFLATSSAIPLPANIFPFLLKNAGIGTPQTRCRDMHQGGLWFISASREVDLSENNQILSTIQFINFKK